MEVIRSLDKALDRVEGWLIILLLWSMVVLTFLQVVLRAFSTQLALQWAGALMGQLDWAEPLVRLAVLWVTFLGASLLTGENRHIKMDLLLSILPARVLPFRDLVLSAACIVICWLMVKASITYVEIEMSSGMELFFGIPVWVGQLILPLGFSLILIRFLLRGTESLLSICKGEES
jgi:TRAP-type C4-dicarboxylate transport system permease small subunit